MGIYFLNRKKNLPLVIQRSITFIYNFEVSRKVALFVILGLIAVYVVFNFHELTEPEIWADFMYVQTYTAGWPFENLSGGSLYHYHVKNALLVLSEQVFFNTKFLPFVASIALLGLTYLFTVQITKKRFAGIVAMGILLQSNAFLLYDTSPTYANFWILFYLLSLFLINKKWQFSFISYVSSLLSKPMTILFLPMSLFFTYRANISKKQKILTVFSYGAVIVVLVIAIFSLDVDLMASVKEHFVVKNFLNGFGALGFSLRFDELFLIFLIPLIFGLFIKSTNGTKQADAVLFLMIGSLLLGPLGHFIGITLQPYRLIPFIIFFAVGVGTLLSAKLANRPVKSP